MEGTAACLFIVSCALYNITDEGKYKYMDTYVDVSFSVSVSQVGEYRRFVEVGHVSHVLNHGELWRIHRLDCIFLHGLILKYAK